VHQGVSWSWYVNESGESEFPEIYASGEKISYISDPQQKKPLDEAEKYAL